MSDAAKKQTETRELPVKLEESDLLKRGQRASEVVKEIGAVREKKKTTSSKLSAQEKELKAELDDLADQIHTKTEKKMIKCKWILDLDRAKKTLFREDTDEKIETIAMTAFEMEQSRQQEIPLKATKEAAH